MSQECTVARSHERFAFCAAFQRRDGGFELTHGRGSDAQSTAWAIQGFVAAGQRPPRSAFAYLAKLRRPDGSYRYSAAIRDDAGVGHVPGAGGAGEEGIPLSHSTCRPAGR